MAQEIFPLAEAEAEDVSAAGILIARTWIVDSEVFDELVFSEVWAPASWFVAFSFAGGDVVQSWCLEC